MPLSDLVLVVMALLTTAMVAAAVCRSLPIPHTVFLVVLGIGLGQLADNWTVFATLTQIQLTPELVFFIFLPALIFESGFNLNARQLTKDLAPVLMLAVPALLISSTLVGLGAWAGLDLPIFTALLFGALISATDPVAVVALFKELGAPLRLNVLVEGESLLNDATAIVLFTILLGFTVHPPEPGLSLVFSAGFKFLWVFLGGAVVGLVFSLVIIELMQWVRFSIAAILTLSLVMAYASFVTAEHVLHVSGVMATAVAAVVLAGYGITRLPPNSRLVLGETWELIAMICNSMLFILVGAAVNVNSLANNAGPIGLAILLVLGARAAGVYTLVPMTEKLFHLPRISLFYRHIMWWGGLKGGLAIAIVLSIPAELPHRELLLHMTIGVVLFTLLVNAPTIRPLMQKMGMDRLSPDEAAELGEALQQAKDIGVQEIKALVDGSPVSNAGSSEAVERVTKAFAATERTVDPQQAERALYLSALRAEIEELNRLQASGVIANYTYLDIKALLLKDRDSHTDSSAAEPLRGDSLFVRLERTLLRRLREQDWAAGWLARYQSLRLSQHLQHNLAGILMSRAAIAELWEHRHRDHAEAKRLVGLYQRRLKRRQDRVATVEKEFPEYFRDYEIRLCTGVALNQALQPAEHNFHHGTMSPKAWTCLNGARAGAIAELPKATARPPKVGIRDLIVSIPLFSDLSENTLAELVGHARTVTFLPGDIVIGEGEKGDALYIVRQGKVQVERGKGHHVEVVAELSSGDFVGETALLGEQLRTATVRSKIPSTMIRLTRRDVLSLAGNNPEVAHRLEKAMAERGRAAAD